LPLSEQHESAEALIAATGADFRIGGARAFYDVSGDYVQVPPQSAFAHPIDYYRTALHELSHLVGSSSRLARDQSGQFGSALYAKEELIAELSAAFLCAALGIVPTVRHADYLGAWLAVLRADSRAIFKAASQASKAADYILAYADPARAGLERAA
jgi:antirestriction protein ArdC